MKNELSRTSVSRLHPETSVNAPREASRTKGKNKRHMADERTNTTSLKLQHGTEVKRGQNSEAESSRPRPRLQGRPHIDIFE